MRKTHHSCLLPTATLARAHFPFREGLPPPRVVSEKALEVGGAGFLNLGAVDVWAGSFFAVGLCCAW